MMKTFLFALLLLVPRIANAAQIIQYKGSSYIEVCIPGNECVISQTFHMTGSSVVKIKEGRTYPGLRYPSTDNGGVQQDKVTGEWIGGISVAHYNELRAAGLQPTMVDPAGDLTKEIAEAQAEINDSFYQCMLGTAACVGGGLAAMGSGGWALGFAVLACIQTHATCAALDRANKELFKKREAAKAKLRKLADEIQNPESGGGSGGGGIGPAPSPPPAGGPPGKIWKCVNTVVSGTDFDPVTGWVCGYV